MIPFVRCVFRLIFLWSVNLPFMNGKMCPGLSFIKPGKKAGFAMKNRKYAEKLPAKTKQDENEKVSACLKKY